MKGLLVSTWLALAACGLCAGYARAEPVEFDCAQLAVAIHNAAMLRDLDANLEKVLAIGRQSGALRGAHWAVMERELRRLWKSRQSADQVAQDIYKRCRAQLGDMGRDG